MKIVIIGKNSYIGNHIQTWLEEKDPSRKITVLDSRNDGFVDYDYTGTDAVIYVGGIVHQPEQTDWNVYKKGNAEDPAKAAELAKAAGVRQFLFLSTMGVYGRTKTLAPNIIDENSIPDLTVLEGSSSQYYGYSKLLGEQALEALKDENFTVTVVRPPNVYGRDCRGGYITGFASILKRIPMIPAAYGNVKQSIIYIDNLCCLIEQLIAAGRGGTFMPQDVKAVSAVELMSMISEGIGLNRRESTLLGIIPKMLKNLPIVVKAYGGIEYDARLSAIEGIDYQVVPSKEGIRRTLQRN